MEPSSENVYASPIIQEPVNAIPQASEYTVEYAGFWRRVAASFFDNAVTTFVGLGLGIVFVIFNIPILIFPRKSGHNEELVLA